MSFDQSEITIGRSPQADCCLVSAMISRLAIRIVITAEEMTLEDVSESGSTINGVHGWGSRPIREGDNIGISPYRLSVKRSA
jgi:predicted component of type VI protein secretion system